VAESELAGGAVPRPAYVTIVGYNLSRRASRAKIQETRPCVVQVPSRGAGDLRLFKGGRQKARANRS
jgi:hypothetical protein